MSAFLEGIGKVIGKIADHIQGRIERAKNKIAKLEKEKRGLQNKPSTVESSLRITAIDDELNELRPIVQNAAKD